MTFMVIMNEAWHDPYEFELEQQENLIVYNSAMSTYPGINCSQIKSKPQRHRTISPTFTQ
jgi:hypothetical protein